MPKEKRRRSNIPILNKETTIMVLKGQCHEICVHLFMIWFIFMCLVFSNMVRFREIFACAKTYCTYVFYTTFTIFVWLCWSITKKWMHVFALLGWIKSTKNIIFLVWNTNLKLVTKDDLCNFSTVLRKFRHCLLMLKKFSFVLFCSRIVVDSAGSSWLQSLFETILSLKTFRWLSGNTVMCDTFSAGEIAGVLVIPALLSFTHR